ncbi:hypothetical protein [Phormidium nigroviride]
MQKLSQKPGFWAQGAIAWDLETGFVIQIFGRMQKLSQKPGFWAQAEARSEYANISILRTIWNTNRKQYWVFA